MLPDDTAIFRNAAELSRLFDARPPRPDQSGRRERVRLAVKAAASAFFEEIPSGPERRRAIEALDTALLLGEAALARSDWVTVSKPCDALLCPPTGPSADIRPAPRQAPASTPARPVGTLNR
jgi:hypothetical protein